MCSIAASMATMEFNRRFNEEVNNWYYTCPIDISKDDLFYTYVNSIKKGAMFDARCFNIPKEEVCNLIYWRQLDATRNSIQMVGQANFSHNELQNCSCNDIQDKLMLEKLINWNNYETRWKRGVAWRKDIGIDFEMPILRGEDRSYVEDVIFVGEK
jgi:tRNA(His) 5'-end guanylyltransferase